MSPDHLKIFQMVWSLADQEFPQARRHLSDLLVNPPDVPFGQLHDLADEPSRRVPLPAAVELRQRPMGVRDIHHGPDADIAKHIFDDVALIFRMVRHQLGKCSGFRTYGISFFVGVFDDPVDCGELFEPSARWSEITKALERCLVVIRPQRRL
jgi:hypothetical protein